MNSKIVLDVIKPKQGPDKKWKAMVPSKEVIGCVYETSLPSDQITFLELKKFLQKNTKDFFSKKKIPGTHKKLIAPTAGSFNNCNGRWLELLRETAQKAYTQPHLAKKVILRLESS